MTGKKVSLEAELERMTGSKKSAWLRAHKPEVIAYLNNYGQDRTLEKFNIRDYHVLYDCLELGKPPAPNHDAECAKLLSQQSLAAVADLRREVRELREQYRQAITLLAEQIMLKFVQALQNIEFKLPEYTEPDPLRMENFPGAPGMQRKQIKGSR